MCLKGEIEPTAPLKYANVRHFCTVFRVLGRWFDACIQLFHRVTHGVKNITQMRSAFVIVCRTERSAFLGATH